MPEKKPPKVHRQSAASRDIRDLMPEGHTRKPLPEAEFIKEGRITPDMIKKYLKSHELAAGQRLRIAEVFEGAKVVGDITALRPFFDKLDFSGANLEEAFVGATSKEMLDMTRFQDRLNFLPSDPKFIYDATTKFNNESEPSQKKLTTHERAMQLLAQRGAGPSV